MGAILRVKKGVPWHKRFRGGKRNEKKNILEKKNSLCKGNFLSRITMRAIQGGGRGHCRGQGKRKQVQKRKKGENGYLV